MKQEHLDGLLRHIQKTLGDLGSATLGLEYNYASLPLCVIDAVYSIGANYISTQRTVKNWCTAQRPAWPLYRPASTIEHCIEELVMSLEGQDFECLARTVFKNRQRTSSRSGILKAEAVYRFAKVLRECGVKRFGDTENAERNKRIEGCIRKIPGQGSGISFSYFLMLGGSDNFVKSDRMLCRFVTDAIQASQPVLPEMARCLVISASAQLKVTPRLLDHVIWKYQRQLMVADARHWSQQASRNL